jgi:iron complex outermembrane receptor protein
MATLKLVNEKRVVIGLDYLNVNSDQLFLGATYDVAPLQSNTFNYNTLNTGTLGAVYAAGGTSAYPYIYKSSTYSSYVSDVLNITDRLIASAALRIDRFDFDGNRDATTGVKTGAYKQTAYSPKFGLIYQVVKDHVSLFSNYQNGFTNQLGKSFDGKGFTPEHANQIEGVLSWMYLMVS